MRLFLFHFAAVWWIDICQIKRSSLVHVQGHTRQAQAVVLLAFNPAVDILHASF